MENESQEVQEPSKPEATIEFKKPVLFGRIGKLPKKVSNEPGRSTQSSNDEKKEAETDCKTKNSLSPAVLLKELSTPIPYKEPKWSGLCPDGSDYALEVLKSGMIMEKVDLCAKPYYVFGRLANCDVILAHPTISRHHAVLQYKAFAEDGEPPSGWYLQDLGSTHGTFLNKERVKASHYSRVRVGHQIKFGTSTRTYILLGPDFDCEGESELSVTEIQKRAQHMKQERDRMIQEAIEQREKDRLLEEKKREEQGIDWGMGEDAEDEPDLADNPYASTANEELYLTDPKKTLRGYFEREGHELAYDCEERGTGQFMCRVELPMDDARGRPVIAEVMHKGKKKEAVIACALEACRILDRAGLLRQAKHESRRRKDRDWSADDYYDSDEDTFLDRTGSVERKRDRRMRQHGGKSETDDKAVTYEQLLNQVSQIESKISTQEKQLETLRSSNKPLSTSASETDALDEYMDSLGKQGQSMAQKAEISKTKMAIQKLKSELSKTRRLADLARPAHLPPLIKKGDQAPVRMANSVVIGKRIRLKEDTGKKHKPRQVSKQEETEFVEEVDSDEETQENAGTDRVQYSNKTEDIPQHSGTKTERTSETQDEAILESERDATRTVTKSLETNASETKNGADSTSEEDSKSKRVFGPMRPPENYVIPESYFEQESDRDLPEIMEDE